MLVVRHEIGRVEVYFILIFLFIYFVLPKSLVLIVSGDFRLIPNYLNFWFIQRYLLVSLCFLYVIYNLGVGGLRFSYREYFFFIFMSLFSAVQIATEQFVVFYSVIGSLTGYILLKKIGSINYINPKVSFLITIFMLAYVIQFLFYRVGGRITSSFLDPNISGYYLFLIYCYFRSSSTKSLSGLVIFVGFVTLSRNFILSVMLFELINLLLVFSLVKKVMGKLRTGFLVLMSTILVSITSYWIVEDNSYSETIGGDVSRLSSLNDGSNYSRASANTDFLNRVSKGAFIIFGNGNEMDSRSSHRPHNAFFRAAYRYGIILAILSVLVYCHIANFYIISNPAFIISLFAYYSILNDFITGNELVLFTIFCHLIYLKKYGDQNST